MMQTLTRRRADAALAALLVVLGVLLIPASEGLIFENNADFLRTSLFMLADVTRGLDTTRQFRAGGFAPIEEFSVAAYVFLAFGWLQRLFSDQYDLMVSSVAGKVALLAGLAVLAHAVAGRERPLVRACLFVGLALFAFAGHNIGMLKSFYFEYAIFLAMPLLLAGFFARTEWGRVLGLGAGGLLAGLAKIQYFYVPLLILACLYVARPRGARISRTTVAALVLSQLVCLIPLWANPHRQVHHYHATYFGTYMLLEQSELRAMGRSDRELACVGVDAWGNFATGPGALDVRPGKPTCVSDRTLTLRDVLEPYWRHPSLAVRMPAFALPAHFTVDYFHVWPSFRLLRVLPGTEGAGQRLLLQLSKWREHYLTPAIPVILVLALAVAATGVRRGDRRYAPALLFCVLLVVSQVAVSLLGDGVRDLSKHLWAAQLGLDLMAPLLLLAVLDFFRHRRTAVMGSPIHPMSKVDLANPTGRSAW
ncbi:hypothetical protein GCM10027034_25550 [Ramlibacter solisilvae]|uniref:Candidate membrane protein n=1 Tax=Ramlibacter tataouinensis TaxID=94132 RepID=A0A127JQD0_9BURK|nr:hypothetical protein [Ramlibacter tataouinensis]AMO22238.1 hypothetical protein UC35_04205 [Ramlibacter tataouinensis]